MVAQKFSKIEEKFTPIPDHKPTVVDYQVYANADIGEEFLKDADFDELNNPDIKVEAAYTKVYYFLIVLLLVKAPRYLCLFVDIILTYSFFWIYIFGPLIIFNGILNICSIPCKILLWILF